MYVFFTLFAHITNRPDGYCLRNPVEQRGSVDFLTRAEKVVGWRTAWVVRELEEQWGELRHLDAWENRHD